MGLQTLIFPGAGANTSWIQNSYKVFKMLLWLPGSLFVSTLFGQNATKTYASGMEHRFSIDSLRLLYGNNKHLPAAFELQALAALSHYPELRNASIQFVVKKSKLPYASRPRLMSLLIPFARKKYRIVISRRSTAVREPTLLKNLGFQEQTGALGHELAHVAYYNRTRKGRIMAEGLKYHRAGFKEQFEKMTDRIAIEHGLCAELLAWNKAVYPVKLRDGNRATIYYSPEEMRTLCGEKNGQ